MRVRRASRFVLAALAVLAALPACTVDEAADVRAYRDVLDAGIDREPALPKGGAPLDLATALRLANERDERLAVAGEVYVQSLLERERVAARFLPRIDLNAGYFLREKVSGISAPRNGLDLPVDGSLEFNPVSDSAALDRTASSAASRRALLLALQDDLLRDVGRAFLEVERAERQADVLRASVGVQEARVEEAKARFEAGVARPLDISLSESRAADARVRLIEAETIARTARTLLGFLVGADLRGVPLDDRVVVPAAQPTPEELRRIAHASRVEIEAAQHEIDAALAAVDEAAGLWWPSVALDVTVFLDRDSEPTDLDWTSFLEVRLPLFTAGRVQIEVRDALSRVRAAKQAHVRAKRAASTDVEDARARFDEVERRAAAVVVRVDAARRSLEQAEALWQTGQGTNLERLVAQDELLSAELELTTADLDRKVRHVEILRAAGTIHGLAGLKRPEPRLTEGPDAEAR